MYKETQKAWQNASDLVTRKERHEERSMSEKKEECNTKEKKTKNKTIYSGLLWYIF